MKPSIIDLAQEMRQSAGVYSEENIIRLLDALDAITNERNIYKKSFEEVTAILNKYHDLLLLRPPER